MAGDKSYLPGMPSLGYETSTGWLGTLTDAQGSVLQTIDSAGATSALVRFDPYGNVRPGSTASSGIGYTGEWADPVGLLNLRFRAYDPTLGQFLSRDSFGGVLASPLTGNRHGYALGNPLRYTDPSGHFVSSNSVAAGIDAWTAAQCTVSSLSACTAEAFVQMTTSERIGWLDDFQSLYETGGWFNNIRGILRVAMERGTDGPWFSRVDASILEAIALGKSAQLGRNPGYSQNPGVTLWSDFFTALGQEESTSDDLRHIWGRAEQSATDYGHIQVAPLSRTLQDEIVLIAFGNMYRLAVSDPEGSRALAAAIASGAAKATCSTLKLGVACELFGSFAGSALAISVADQLADPRNEWAAYQFTHWLYDANVLAANVSRP